MPDHRTLPVRIQGYCPMGCGETLHLAADGTVTCADNYCPDPNAVSKIIGDGETEHVVTLRAKDFTIRHPLRERIDGALEDCDLHLGCVSLHPSEVVPGTYRVTYVGIDQDSASLGDTGWHWDRIGDPR